MYVDLIKQEEKLKKTKNNLLEELEGTMEIQRKRNYGSQCIYEEKRMKYKNCKFRVIIRYSVVGWK